MCVRDTPVVTPRPLRPRPVVAKSGYRSPSMGIAEATRSISARSSAVRCTLAASRFSFSRCSLVVPGIGTIDPRAGAFVADKDACEFLILHAEPILVAPIGWPLAGTAICPKVVSSREGAVRGIDALRTLDMESVVGDRSFAGRMRADRAEVQDKHVGRSSDDGQPEGNQDVECIKSHVPDALPSSEASLPLLIALPVDEQHGDDRAQDHDHEDIGPSHEGEPGGQSRLKRSRSARQQAVSHLNDENHDKGKADRYGDLQGPFKNAGDPQLLARDCENRGVHRFKTLMMRSGFGERGVLRASERPG
jgi:hypothetical protein